MISERQLKEWGFEMPAGSNVARKTPPAVKPGEVRPVTTAPPQIRVPVPPQPNKTEARFIEWAKRHWHGRRVDYETLRFRLPSGTHYTPDVVIHPANRSERIICVEVKGPHIHNQRSLHAWKEARAAYPCVQWIFAQWQGGEWAIAGESIES